jgi:hypothetical protein
MKTMGTWFDAAAEVNGTTPSISKLNELYARVLPILPASVTSNGRVRNVNQLTWVRVVDIMRDEEKRLEDEEKKRLEDEKKRLEDEEET